MADHNVDWEPCAVGGCIGVRLSTGRKCWAHANDHDLDAALTQFGEHGRLDARGVPLTTELLHRLLAAAPPDDQGHAVLTGARFDHATFHDDARFHHTTFEGDTWFLEATFEGDAMLDEAAFGGDALFQGAVFHGYAGFRRAAFHGYAGFERAAFHTDVRFDHATFAGDTRFIRAAFEGDAVFNEVTFRDNGRFGDTVFEGNGFFERAVFHREARFGRAVFGGARFIGATIQQVAWFDGVTFEGDARFELAVFHRDARFDRATFQRAPQLGPMLVRKALVLNGVVFHERVQIEAAAAACCCQRARFLAGVQLRVRWAQVALDGADLAAPSILTGVPAFPGIDESRWARAMERIRAADTGGWRPVVISQPRVVSLRHADVAGLTVAAADLRACRFAGAHHLDRLHAEESNYFPHTPRGWRWTTRQTIAEEHHWRARRHPDATINSKGRVFALTPTGWGWVARQDAEDHGQRVRRHPNATIIDSHGMMAATRPTPAGRGDWYHLAHQPPTWLEVEQVPPAQVAALYRALRKGREDNKDEPGAADFYYGEMEMRRHAKREQARHDRRHGHRGPAVAASIEHAILWLYWLISGYGLRAWRAVMAVLVVLAVFAVLMVAFGFQHPASGQATGAATAVTTPARMTQPSDTSFPAAVIYGARTAIGLPGDPQPALTRWGDVMQIIVRITVPVLLGLAVLSIRGRVKR
jgi:uncharacterized protein YjbI with pentapeptide repeats